VRFLCISYGAELAGDIAVKMRRLVQGEWYQRLWGDRVKILEDQKSRENFANGAGGERMSYSIEGGILGRGGDIQLLDDPNGIKDKNSAATREATLDGLRQLVTRVTDPRSTARILVQQRVHEDDATNFALEHWDNVTHLMFPSRFDPAQAVPEDPRTQDGELLWPEVWGDIEVKAEEEALGEIDAAGQLQQRPVPRHGAIVSRKSFKSWPFDEPGADERSMYFCTFCRWSGPVESYATVMCPSCGGTAAPQVPYPPFILRVLSVDTSYGEKETNSYSAATRWGIWLGRDSSPRAMLCAAWRGRPRLFGDRSAPGLIDHINTMASRPNQECDFVLIERKTRGVDLYNELERLSVRWPYQLVYFEPKGRGDKVVRLQACTGMFSQNLVWAPDRGWADMVINETVSYPRGKFQDLTDTLVQFLLWARDNGYLLYGVEHRIEEQRKKVFTRAKRRVSEMIEGH
jgi:phage terminase large subunit-like protein